LLKVRLQQERWIPVGSIFIIADHFLFPTFQ
jgi:hypothetical protein